MTTFVNLTGHPLQMYEGGQKVRTIPADGRAYRLSFGDQQTDIAVGGVTITSLAYRVNPLPVPEPDTWLIVSQVAALGLRLAGIDRRDIVFPGPGVSQQGRVVGSRGLLRLTQLGERAS